MKSAELAGIAVFAGVAFLGAPAAIAADEEIQVYMDEIGPPKKLTLDTHVNNVIDGRGVRDYSGQQISEGRTRITPEFGYALNGQFELGAYLPLANFSRGGDLSVDGVKLRLKYVAPRPETQHWYWGANLEVGYVNHSLDPNPWNGELKGIVGGKWGKWTLAGNLNLDFKVSGPQSAPTEVQIATKAAYAITEKTSIGIESYNGLGSLKHLSSLGRNDQQIYAVIDTSFGDWDLNFGVGYGYGDPEDHCTVKMVIGIPL
ncbi:MAG: hypothetical protein ABI740_00845 [Alphaproteobacteria bacterium]